MYEKEYEKSCCRNDHVDCIIGKQFIAGFGNND